MYVRVKVMRVYIASCNIWSVSSFNNKKRRFGMGICVWIFVIRIYFNIYIYEIVGVFYAWLGVCFVFILYLLLLRLLGLSSSRWDNNHDNKNIFKINIVNILYIIFCKLDTRYTISSFFVVVVVGRIIVVNFLFLVVRKDF